MRILIVNSEYPPVGGGAGNASANLALCLASFGHDVVVLTSRFDGVEPFESAGGVTVYRVHAMRRWVDRSSALEQIAFIVSGSFRALGLAREFKPDVTLAFFGMPSGAVAWVLKKFYRIPYVVSLRGGDVPGFRPYDFMALHKMMGPLLHRIWHAAGAVVANSNGLRELALAFDPAIEIPIIPNGVDGTLFQAGARDWRAARIFSAGRVVYQKGLDLGLRALARLKSMDWQWAIAGDGPQMDALRSLARELGIADRVTFLGWQSRQQLVRCNDESTLFLFPSRHEGMPNAVLEAMASGLPVVATRIAGNEELVIDGVTGLLVAPEDVDSLQKALHALLAEPGLRERMGRASRERAEKEYSWDNAARSYSRLLEQVACPGTPASMEI